MSSIQRVQIATPLMLWKIAPKVRAKFGPITPGGVLGGGWVGLGGGVWNPPPPRQLVLSC